MREISENRKRKRLESGKDLILRLESERGSIHTVMR